MNKRKFGATVIAILILAGCGASTNESEPGKGEAATADCPQADNADLTAITQKRADMLIGFTESDAEACATSLGWAFRVGERDGESFALTEDYSQQRITVSLT
ncbi:MAG: hypothetical protein ACKO2A_06395, partial [Acidimicrobiaceae bacterium]